MGLNWSGISSDSKAHLILKKEKDPESLWKGMQKLLMNVAFNGKKTPIEKIRYFKKHGFRIPENWQKLYTEAEDISQKATDLLINIL